MDASAPPVDPCCGRTNTSQESAERTGSARTTKSERSSVAASARDEYKLIPAVGRIANAPVANVSRGSDRPVAMDRLEAAVNQRTSRSECEHASGAAAR